jgi:hypothetical protein
MSFANPWQEKQKLLAKVGLACGMQRNRQAPYYISFGKLEIPIIVLLVEQRQSGHLN